MNTDFLPDVTPPGLYKVIVSYVQGTRFIFGFELVAVIKPK